MYFYNHKTYKNEQTQLLEMCGNAGINSWNGAGVFISQLIQLFLKGLRKYISATLFYLVNHSFNN